MMGKKKAWDEIDMTGIHRGHKLPEKPLAKEPGVDEMEAQFRGKGKKIKVKI